MVGRKVVNGLKGFWAEKSAAGAEAACANEVVPFFGTGCAATLETMFALPSQYNNGMS